MNKVEGFVYVATGAGYLKEACHSVASLKKFHPNHRVCLISDLQPPEPSLFDDFILCREVENMPIDKTLLTLCTYDRIVYLDTDTEVLNDLSSLFQILDSFELAVSQDINRGWDYDLPGIPLCFSEFNTGVMALRNNPGMKQFFEQWKTNYHKLWREDGFSNDQPSFRLSLFRSTLRFTPLPGEFNFLTDFPNYLLGEAHLLHGRGNFFEIKRDLLKRTGMRVYLPGVGVLNEFRGKLDWVKQSISFLFRASRLLISPPPDYPSRKPHPWWRKTRENT